MHRASKEAMALKELRDTGAAQDVIDSYKNTLHADLKEAHEDLFEAMIISTY